jgi:hypothetical protein
MHPTIRRTLVHVLDCLGPDRVLRAEPTFDLCLAGLPPRWTNCFFHAALGADDRSSAYLRADMLGIDHQEFAVAVMAFDAAFVSGLPDAPMRVNHHATGLQCTVAELAGVTAEFHQLVLDWLPPAPWARPSSEELQLLVAS